MNTFLDNIDAADDNGSGGRHYLTVNPGDEGAGGTDGPRYFTESRMIMFGVYMNIGFNVNRCTGSNLNSWVSGITLGYSYQHMGGTLSTSGNTIYYSVRGLMHYNIFFEGIGTIYSQNKNYSGTYSCN